MLITKHDPLNILSSVSYPQNIKKNTTINIEGKYIEPAYGIVWKAKFKKMRPNFKAIGVGGDNADFIREGFNGKAWEYNEEDGVIYSEGEAKKTILVSNEFDHAFIDAVEKGYSITLGINYAWQGLMGDISTPDNEAIRRHVLGTPQTRFHGWDLLLGLASHNPHLALPR